jgi:hypothetical protein
MQEIQKIENVDLSKRIIHMGDEEKMLVLIAAITKIDNSYADGQMSDAKKMVAASLIKKHFRHLSYKKIDQAYELWAVGKVKAPQIYGSNLTPQHIGQVLAAYVEQNPVYES